MSANERIGTISQWAKIIAWAGLVVILLASLMNLLSPLFFDDYFAKSISEAFLKNPDAGTFTLGQNTVAAILLFLSNLPGIVALYVAIKLFSHFRKGNVFTLYAARTLRLMGWCVVLIAPLDQICTTIGTAYFSSILKGTMEFSIEIESAYFFAFVFGLVIVAIGHIMVEATTLSQENKSFI